MKDSQSLMQPPEEIEPRVLQGFPCRHGKAGQVPIVLVHGWGAGSEIWQDMPQLLSENTDVYTVDLPGFGASPALDNYSEQQLLAWLGQQLPSVCHLIGLSLGGMLCRAYAARYPQRVGALVTIATNRRFVATDNYLAAMSQTDFSDFSHSWHQHPAQCLKRFKSLQCRGDRQQRQLIRELNALQTVIDPVAAEAMLDLLATLDESQLPQTDCPRLAIFGAEDSLVPVAAAEYAPDNCRVITIEGASHLPHLSAQPTVIHHIQEFLATGWQRFDKHRVARAFGRAAANYDSAARVQDWSARQLIASFPDDLCPRSIIDLGCGTGVHAQQLKTQFPNARVTAIDIAQGMLHYGRDRYGDKSIHWLCCDAESLALAPQSQTLIFSNFSLQWCDQLRVALQQIYDALTPGGMFYFAVPGPKTLWELQDASERAGLDSPVNSFWSIAQWHKALVCLGFGQIDLRHTTQVEHHSSVKALLRSIKAVGANTKSHAIQQSATGQCHGSGKSRGFSGKSSFEALERCYRKQRTERDTIPATWEIIVGSVIKCDEG